MRRDQEAVLVYSANTAVTLAVGSRLGTYEVVALLGVGGMGEVWWRVSTDGGAQTRWRQDGKEIYFYSNSRIFAADVSTQGDAFQLGAVSPLFTFQAGQTRYAYDVTPDGQHFLVNARIVNQSPSPPLTVVVNWPATLNP